MQIFINIFCNNSETITAKRRGNHYTHYCPKHVSLKGTKRQATIVKLQFDKSNMRRFCLFKWATVSCQCYCEVGQTCHNRYTKEYLLPLVYNHIYTCINYIIYEK